MELRQLRYFVMLAEHLHFGQAAEALGLAQSALSMQLQALEKELDVKLVARTKRSVALTSAGKLFLEQARATLAQAEHAELVARQAGRGEVGSLEIGYVISATCSGVVQKLLSAYNTKFPGVNVRLHELESPMQAQLLEEGKLDCCIVRSAVGDPFAYEKFTVLKEPVIVAMAANHTLAKKKTLSAKELENEKFIAPQFYNQLGFVKHLLAIGAAGGFTPAIIQHARDFITALTLASSGLGVAVVPDSLRVIQLPNLVYKSISDMDEKTELYLLFRRHESSPFVTSLIEIVKKMALL